MNNEIQKHIALCRGTTEVLVGHFDVIFDKLGEVYNENPDLQELCLHDKDVWDRQIKNERGAVNLAVSQLESLLREAESGTLGDERAKQWSLEALSAIAMCQNVASSIGSRVRSAVGAAAKVVANWVTNHLNPIINNISSHLWSIVSRLLNLKGWSVTGGVSAGMFGFASGSVSITLEFG